MGLDFNYFLNRQGVRGKRGERGEQGFSPLISVKTQTANEYILTVQNEDGSFDTPNLKGNAIANNGGTYIRYNPLTEEMYTGDADYATNEQAGVVLLSTYAQLEAGGSEGLIPTSADVYDLIQAKIASIGQGYVTQTEFDNYTAATALTLNGIAGDISTLDTSKMSFTDLVSSLVQGDNITLVADAENKTITINATGGDLSNYVTLDTAQTITNSKTFDGNGVIYFSNTSNGLYFEDSSSTERIRIFTARHSSGVDYSDLTMQSYSDMQFRLLQPTKTVRLTDIITANTLANSAVQPEDMATYLAGYVDLTTNQSITGTKTFNNLRVKNQLIVPNGYIQSGGTSDLRIRSTASSITLWGDHIYATTDNTNKVDLTHAQVTDNLVTSIDNTSSDTEYPSAKCVYDNLETKADKSQTHALKGYSDNGELLTDAEGLADVKSYAHSTFDLSKFTIVGSPNITDDGVALTTSSNNYIKTSVVNFSTASTWKIKGKFKAQSTAVESNILSGNANQYIALIFNGVSKNIRIALGDGSSWFIESVAGASNLSLNAEYEYEFIYDGTGYLLNLNGSEYISKQTSTSKVNNTPILFGVNRNGYEPSANDKTIDLKQFSITVDGVPVFSGNKTGIDTIKPDDYTVVGTPTISADGVASGFSASTSIKPNNFTIGQLKEKSWAVEGVFYYIVGTNQGCVFRLSQTWQAWGSIVSTDNSVIFRAKTGTSEDSSTEGNKITINPSFTEDTYCKCKVEYNHGTGVYKLSIGKLGEDYTQTGTWTATTTNTELYTISTNPTNTFVLGQGSDGDYFREGSIDLNAFKIYVDGNLVYQPCLKIPYIESKTGSKIVSSTYRSRVNDMAEQFGYANYYTLDEDNGNFTLPQGELFGLIGDKTLRDSYYNGVTYWELFSNRRLEQGGTCVSGVEYTLPRPFADANYVLTIPYSSKTATSFIPSATGDFIAKGMGLL